MLIFLRFIMFDTPTASVLCSYSVFAGGSCGWELIDASQNRRFRVTF